MFAFFSRLFSATRRRSNHSFNGQATVMEPRQMLAATVGSTGISVPFNFGPFIPDQLGNFYTNGGSSKVFVSTSSTKGSEVGTFSIYSLSTTESSVRVTLTGKNASAFTVQRTSIDINGTATYSIRVASPNLVRTFSRFDLTLSVQYASGVAPATRNFTIVTATAQTITMDENPTEGQLLGRLPVGLRGTRMQYSMVGATNRNDASPYGRQPPISIGSGGHILAHQVSPFVLFYDNITLNAYESTPAPRTSNVSDIAIYDRQTLFDYEGVSTVSLNNGSLHSGDVLIEAYDPLRNTTQRVVIHVQLRNIDEVSSIQNQWVGVGLNGTGGRIVYTDPDRNNFGTSNPFSGPHEVKILDGNSEGLFEIAPGNDSTWYSPTGATLKIAKPELLAGRTSFTLKVQLLERGRAVGEATITVNVDDRYWISTDV